LYNKKQVIGKTIGAAAAPMPVNTPSLKSEIKNKEAGNSLSSGTGGSSSWNQGQNRLSDSPQSKSLNATNGTGSKPAPWAKPITALPPATQGEDPAPNTIAQSKPVASSVRKSWAADDESDEDERESSPQQESWPDNFRELPADTSTQLEKNDRESYHNNSVWDRDNNRNTFKNKVNYQILFELIMQNYTSEWQLSKLLCCSLHFCYIIYNYVVKLTLHTYLVHWLGKQRDTSLKNIYFFSSILLTFCFSFVYSLISIGSFW
jgi:hypothetical protein